MRRLIDLLRRAQRSFRGSLGGRLAVVIAAAVVAGAFAGLLPAVIGQAIGAVSAAAPAPPASALGRMIDALLPDGSVWGIVAVALLATVVSVGIGVVSSQLSSTLSGDVTAAMRSELMGAVMAASPRDVASAGEVIVAPRGPGRAPSPAALSPEPGPRQPSSSKPSSSKPSSSKPSSSKPRSSKPSSSKPRSSRPDGTPAVTGASREAVVRLAVSREAAMVSDFSVSVITGLPQSVATLLVLTYELIAGRAWIVLAGGLGLFVLSRLLADRASRRVGGARRELTAADAVVFGSLSEHIKASEDLRLWGARDQAVAEFSEVAHACAKARARFAAALAVSGQIKRVVTAMSPLLIIVAVTVAGGEFDAGEVAKLLLLVPLLMSRLEALDGIRQGNFERGPMIDATVKLLRLPPAPVRAVDARRLDLAQVKGEVAFDAVGFTPPGTTACVLDDVSIHIPAGAVVGICGPSGSGKSTLLRLLLRLDDPTTGMVRLDDTDVRLVEPAQLPDLFGVVRQTSSLLQRAVRENLSLGLDPPPDDDAMRAALERVHLDDLADPRGRRDLDTAYRANPPNFSGGECRRLLIARMLLSPAPVLALDEPEAGLPSATAEDILMAIAGAANGRTTLVVTHAPHLLDSDFNVVLDAGRVAAMGKHEELVEQSETYRQLLADAVVGGS